MESLTNNTSGESNTSAGCYALSANSLGDQNVAYGVYALTANTTGSNNTAIGFQAFNAGTNYTNSTAIGYNAQITVSNKVRIGSAAVTVIEGQVAYTFPSDGRFKANIVEEVPGLDFINRLRPVVYNFDTRRFDEFLMQDMPDSLCKKNINEIDYASSSAVRQSGFIAQEVEKAAKECGYNFNGVHKPENDKDNYSVAYSLFVVPLVKAVQEQQQIIQSQQKEIAELKAMVEKIMSRAGEYTTTASKKK
jgi:hypothetical protein